MSDQFHAGRKLLEKKREREGRGGEGGARERGTGGGGGGGPVSRIAIQSLGLRVSVSRQLRIGEGYKDRIETGGRSTCEGCADEPFFFFFLILEKVGGFCC